MRNLYETFIDLISILVSAPITPTVLTDDDTRNFEDIETSNGASVEAFSVSKTFVGNQLSFIGFSYSNEQQ
jgi:hypothetical protein